MPTNTPYKYIQTRGDKFSVVFPRHILEKRRFGTYTTIEQAILERNRELRRLSLPIPNDFSGTLPEHPIKDTTPIVEARRSTESVPSGHSTRHLPAEIDGAQPAGIPDIAEIWRQVQDEQRAALPRHRPQRRPRVRIPQIGNLPVAIAMLSDLHLGSAGTDYEQAYNDAKTVAGCDGFYASFHGDGFDNWIVGKLANLERHQIVGFKRELALFVDWLSILKHKFLWVVAGNHDNWTEKLAGIDIVAESLKGVRTLYDQYQVVFDLEFGSAEWLVMVRHKWRYSSVYNPTHGIEVNYDRGDVAFDIGIGGHTHIATICRPFWRHDRQRWAILTGTYKKMDSFSKEIGFPSSKGTGAGAMLLWPDGRKLFIDDIETAASYLRFARAEAAQA